MVMMGSCLSLHVYDGEFKDGVRALHADCTQVVSSSQVAAAPEHSLHC